MKRLVSLLLVLGLSGGWCWGGKETLHGIRALRITVEELNKDAKRVGLKKATMKTFIKLRLEKAGMRVTDGFVLPRDPQLYVSINCTATTNADGKSTGFTVCSIDCELKQLVTIEGVAEMHVAVTWNLGALVLAPDEEMAKVIQDNLANIVDAFLKDWVAENPTGGVV
ncbi:MAG: hypothetical protein HQ559_13305 [Lentisphaerae bacterium]|nr:hypothetical protein [Lentisphaerota bacterium]